jgi:beta-carotene ketolase (CrtO type)
MSKIRSEAKIKIMSYPKLKASLKFLLLSVPYKIKGYTVTDYSNEIPSLEWDKVKEQYGDRIIDMIAEKYIHNLKKIILKRVVYSPIHFEKKPTTSINGTLSCGPVVPY